MHRPAELMALRRHSIAAVLQKTVRAWVEASATRRISTASRRDRRKFLSFVAFPTHWWITLAPKRKGRGVAAPLDRFQREVQQRLGVLPHFFASTPAAPALAVQLWTQAKAAYLDNPLPSLFKER